MTKLEVNLLPIVQLMLLSYVFTFLKSGINQNFIPIFFLWFAFTIVFPLTNKHLRYSIAMGVFFFSCGIIYFSNISFFNAETNSLKYFLQFVILTFGVNSFLRKTSQFRYSHLFKNWLDIFFTSVMVYSFFALIVNRSHWSNFVYPQYKNSYQILSDLLAIIGIIYSSKRTTLLNLFRVIVILYFIIILGSRSALLFYVFAILLSFGYMKLKNSKNKVKYLIGGTLVSMILLVLSIWEIMQNEVKYYRLFSILQLANTDSSTVRRVELWTDFTDNISNSLSMTFFGGGAYNVGGYVHNIFSIWQYFGFFNFVFFILLSILICITGLRNIQNLPLIFFLFLSMIISRAWNSPVYGMFLGVGLCTINRNVRLLFGERIHK